MGQFITSQDVPMIELVDANQLIADAEADALSRIPELAQFTEDVAGKPVPANILGIFRRIVVRWHIEGPAALASNVMGPYQIGLDPNTRHGWKLSPDDVSDLRRAAGVPDPADESGPRGEFPPDQISAIFNPRR